MTMDLIVKGAAVVFQDGVKQVEIGIKNGIITAIEETVHGDSKETIHASGLTVLPGAVDVHVHLNEPGLGHWEGFDTGTAALAAGGCTTYFDMPLNGRPPTVTEHALQLKLSAARSSRIDYGIWGGLMPGYMNSIGPLAEAGVIGFKAFMCFPGSTAEGDFREVDDIYLLRGMEAIAPTGRLLALHAESEPIVAALTKEMRRAGRTDARAYARARPVWAERDAVRRALLAAELTGCPVHFVHISSAAAALDIADARRAGLDASIETCAHYLTLTEDDLVEIGGAAKCSPPLRDKANMERLWELVADGTIDIVSSDHSPCPPEMKASDDFFAIWGGISGAQSTLELMLDEGHMKRGIPLSRIAQLTAGAPAERFGITDRKGAIEVGRHADLVLVDLNGSYQLERGLLFDRHRHSPYVGRQFGCRVVRTIVRGVTVYADGALSGEAGGGMLVRPSVLAPTSVLRTDSE
ncbi:allantoinase AllB [Paenibacillus xylaniclasticus]|uniref:allantoinase AllB n=1 Tax=Paenibacillus xylaniclasticus TaxID=588083 RepID=UPI000FDC415F|nr:MULTISPECIES: allantoinase AllB [Paenibacillus]GFN33625.1 allantoinase [Paenibacillus curdlanolyticus]